MKLTNYHWFDIDFSKCIILSIFPVGLLLSSDTDICKLPRPTTITITVTRDHGFIASRLLDFIVKR